MTGIKKKIINLQQQSDKRYIVKIKLFTMAGLTQPTI